MVRAKRKIKDANIAFKYPDADEFAERLTHVLNAIYALYSIDINNDYEALQTNHSLSGEAIFLCQLINKLLPQSSEGWGLTALMAFSAAREQARVVDGIYIPLSEQDVSLWDDGLIVFAEHALNRAKSLKHIGRFQLEAAVQSVHCHRKITGNTDWLAVCQLYFGLLQHTPSLGAYVAYASAIAEAYGVEAGLTELDKLAETNPKAIANFQPYHACKGLLLKRANKDATYSLSRAIELTNNEVIKTYLLNLI